MKGLDGKIISLGDFLKEKNYKINSEVSESGCKSGYKETLKNMTKEELLEIEKLLEEE